MYARTVLNTTLILQLRRQLRSRLVFVPFSPSPVTVPAEPPGLPGAECHRCPVPYWGRVRASAPTRSRRPRTGRYRRANGKAGSGERAVRFGGRVSEQHSGGKHGSFSCRSNYWSHSDCDPGPPPRCQAAATCWWHVAQMKTWSPINSPICPPPNGRAGNYVGLLFTQTGTLDYSCFAFIHLPCLWYCFISVHVPARVKCESFTWLW